MDLLVPLIKIIGVKQATGFALMQGLLFFCIKKRLEQIRFFFQKNSVKFLLNCFFTYKHM